MDKKAKIKSDKNQPKISPKRDSLKNKINELEQKLQQASDQKLRALADYQNLQARTEKEKLDFIKFANEKLLLKIIEVKDTIDRAEVFVTDPGLKIVSDQISALLKENNVVEVKAIGQDYDPNTMECVDKNDCDNEIVVKVSQKAYKLGDRVIRPAQVVVGQVEK